jgi:hypothetical protein
VDEQAAPGARQDCRHYIRRTTQGGDLVQRCRLAVAAEHPFSCPPDCLFFEERPLSTAGWSRGTDQPMSNTAWGIAALPPPKPRSSPPGSRSGNRKKGRKSR